ncbi:hypothetical protein SEPCBS119000_005212 [Sporothrix epigloea]|uniref:Inositol polyphosphate-related phosphatase domain-containing protein n=1 Tax=Sporothrix epigloea TaxID=1892477 RepID=A0ABP0DWB6_9PEZI
MAQPLCDAARIGSSPTLDLLLLTFNCAKAPINVADFAGHLQRALASHSVASNTTSLPDLVVFSLQEVAPLGCAFVGSYFLDPYLSRFGEALYLAVSRAKDGHQLGDDSNEDDEETGETVQIQQGQPRPQKKAYQPYHFVRQANVGMTAILMFARDPSAVHDVEVAHCGFGVADMGNKGAVGLRISYGNKDAFSASKLSKLTFVATHLAAMEWNVRLRNANWQSIAANLTFGNPKALIAKAASGGDAAAAVRGHHEQGNDETVGAPPSGPEENEAEAAEAAGDEELLLPGQEHHKTDMRRQLQNLSIFRPDSLLFVAGDLNYRISDQSPPDGAVFPTTSTWHTFFERDQLTSERLARRAFHGMNEAPINFPPTYKYSVLSKEQLKNGVVPDNADEVDNQRHAESPESDVTPPVPWKYATHRWPSWCDRVLYLDVPESVKARWRLSRQAHAPLAAGPEVKVLSYQSLPLMRTSDHQPVYFRALVPVLPKSAYEQAEEELLASESDPNGPVDPRIQPPIALDTDAWARRSQARRREIASGAFVILFYTKEGAAVILTTTLVGICLYWTWLGLM